MKNDKEPHIEGNNHEKQANEPKNGLGEGTCDRVNEDYAAEVERLRGELDEANKRSHEYASLLQRIQADFANHVRRSDTERKDMVKGASRDIIMKLLDVQDTMELALKTAPSSDDGAKMLDGFRRVYGNLKMILASEGLDEVNAEGTFNHDIHEADDTVEDDSKADGTIADVIQKGYMLNGRLLRTAKVVVVKNRGETNGKDNRY